LEMPKISKTIKSWLQGQLKYDSMVSSAAQCSVSEQGRLVMNFQEALKIVLELARENMIDSTENLGEHERQKAACNFLMEYAEEMQEDEEVS